MVPQVSGTAGEWSSGTDYATENAICKSVLYQFATMRMKNIRNWLNTIRLIDLETT